MILQGFSFEIQTIEWITMITLKNNGDLFFFSKNDDTTAKQKKNVTEVKLFSILNWRHISINKCQKKVIIQ